MRWAILILALLLVPAISAAPTLTFQHEEIQPGETIFAVIETVGEFTQEIPESSISFYDGRRKISFEHDLIQYGGTYYLYIYATRAGNFTLKIPNALYKEADQLNSIDFDKEFSVAENIIYSDDGNVSGTKVLSIKPGHIFSINAPTIKLINRGTMPLELSYLENDTTLQPQETREVEFYPEETFSSFEVSSYKDFSVPVVYLSANGSILENETEEEVAALRSSTTFLTINLIKGNETSEEIELFNFIEENLTDITFETAAPVEISGIETLQAKAAENITLTFTPDQVGHIQENLTIKYKIADEEKNMTIILSLYVLPEGSSEEDFAIVNGTCADKSGQVCAPGFRCGGDTILTSSNEYCCIGTCEKIEDPSKKDDSSGGWIWGVVIFVVLVGVGYYLYRRSRKLKKPTSDEKLKETSEKYSKRLSGKNLQRT